MHTIVNLTTRTVRGLDTQGTPMGEGFEPVRGKVVTGELSDDDRQWITNGRSGLWTFGGQEARIVGLEDPQDGVWYIIPIDWLLIITMSGRELWDLLVVDEEKAVIESFSGGVKGHTALRRVAPKPS